MVTADGCFFIVFKITHTVYSNHIYNQFHNSHSSQTRAIYNQRNSLSVDEINMQVPSSDVITSLCVSSSVSETRKMFVYVNSWASTM